MIKIVQGLAIVHPQPLNDFYYHSFSFRESREKCVFATSLLNYPHAHLWLGKNLVKLYTYHTPARLIKWQQKTLPVATVAHRPLQEN